MLAAADAPRWRPSPADPPRIAACVVAFPRGGRGAGAAGDPGWAAAAVVAPGGAVVAEAVLAGQAGGPYAPGSLALREGPLLHAALQALGARPDVVLVDATGRDHPRGAGLAVHLGAIAGLPTVGVTHRPLLAEGAWPPPARGATAPLLLDGVRVGAWLRTRAGARPVAVHAGWRTDVEVALEVVLAATGRHRTPEPIRHARRIARLARAGAQTSR